MRSSLIAALPCAAVLLSAGPVPVDAGVTISYSSSSCNGNATITYCDEPPPACGYSRPCGHTQCGSYPITPTYYCAPYRPPAYGYNPYVPPYAYGGWSIGPPTVFTSPPSFYGFDRSARTVRESALPTYRNEQGSRPYREATERKSAEASRELSSREAVSISSKGDAPISTAIDPITIEELDSRTVLIRWNADDPNDIASVVFYTGDIFQTPVEARRVTQAPFHTTMRLTNSVRNVGATVTYEDGSQTTRWIPYSPLSR